MVTGIAFVGFNFFGTRFQAYKTSAVHQRLDLANTIVSQFNLISNRINKYYQSVDPEILHSDQSSATGTTNDKDVSKGS